MKNYVKISSTINVSVTSGLQYQDATNRNSDVPNRLKISPSWPKMTIDVKQGVHWYPSEITEWDTVKCLVKDKVLTIGEFSDVSEEEYAVQMKQKLGTYIKKEEKVKVIKKQSLDKLATEVE